MANVKSRLKAPKSASTKKKKKERTVKKTLISPKKSSTGTKKSLTSTKKLVTSSKNSSSTKDLKRNTTESLTSPKELLTSPNNSSTSPNKLVASPTKSSSPKKSVTSNTKSSKSPKKSVTSPKKSSTSSKRSDLERNGNNIDCDVVMKRPSTRKVMTPDEKVQFVLKNGHRLKKKFIAKPPVNVKRRQITNEEPKECFERKNNTDLPLLSQNGHLKKKAKQNTKLVDSVLMSELMISNGQNGGNTVEPPRARSPSVPPATVRSSPVVPSSSPMGVDNNNDIDITDQNNSHDISDSGSEYKATDEISGASDDYSTDRNCSDDSIEKSVKKSLNLKKKPKKKQSKRRHVTLKNGLVLKLAFFECDYCHQTFNRKSTLCRHIYKHLGLKPFNCHHCHQEFRSRYNLQIHLTREHKESDNDPELFICNFCEKPFLIKENLKKHLDTHANSENVFKCIYCGKVYPHHTLLMQHEKKHMVKGRHVCSLCSMSYSCRNLLYMHVKSHLKIKDYVCQYCGKDFLRPNSLTRHVEVNHGGHRIVCPICNKNLKGHLTEHMRTHEKKRPHVCPECGQRFTQSTQMKVHRRSHSGVRPYPCRICKRFFSHSNALMLHIRCHTGEKPFPCAMCPMSFSQLPHMKTHMRKIHGKENAYKCNNCNSFYKLKSQLDVHAKTCTAGPTVDQPTKDKKKKSKKGEDEIEVESPMSLSRMRFLLALLLTMIATKEKLKYLGFNKRLVDEILVESLEAMGQEPCKDDSLPPAKRLKTNIELFIIGTVPKEQMENFKKENKSTEDILELLTTEKDK